MGGVFIIVMFDYRPRTGLGHAIIIDKAFMQGGLSVFGSATDINQKSFLNLTKPVHKHAVRSETAVKEPHRIKGLVV